MNEFFGKDAEVPYLYSKNISFPEELPNIHSILLFMHFNVAYITSPEQHPEIKLIYSIHTELFSAEESQAFIKKYQLQDQLENALTITYQTKDPFIYTLLRPLKVQKILPETLESITVTPFNMENITELKRAWCFK